MAIICPVCTKQIDPERPVFCPVCGTPHHRACYHALGHCINEEKHDEGFVCEAPADPAEASPEDAHQGPASGTFCAQCGAPAGPGDKTCARCGTPLRGAADRLPAKLFCPHCGAEADSHDLYCRQCRRPLRTPTAGRTCPACGAETSAGDSRCPRCHRPLSPNPFSSQGIPPFGAFAAAIPLPAPDAEIDDGITAGDIAAYVGVNAPYYLRNFIRIKNRAASFNWVGFVFPTPFLFYRKLWKYGILSLLISILSSLPQALYTVVDTLSINPSGLPQFVQYLISDQYMATTGVIVMFAGLAWELFCGFFANHLYFRKARRDILGILAQHPGDIGSARQLMLQKKGGVSVAGAALALLSTAVVFYGVAALLML